MEPTIRVGERIVVDRTAFWFRKPQRWEIVVFLCPHQPTELCVKRVAGLPGETVQIRGGLIYANGKPQPSPIGVRYGARSGQEFGDSPEYALGPNEYFVLGDNSGVSEDSRYWEPPAIPANQILGKPVRRDHGAIRTQAATMRTIRNPASVRSLPAAL